MLLFSPHIWGILTNPKHEWKLIRCEKKIEHGYCIIIRLAIMALIPSICSYYGAVEFGWSPIYDEEPIKISHLSALYLSICSWLAIILGVTITGYLIHWIGQIFKCTNNKFQCINFAFHTSIPLYMTGISGLYPSITLSMLTILIGFAGSAYLLYTGLPIFMNMSKDKGFFFSTAIVCMTLVLLVVLKTATVIFWEIGFEPEFLDHIT